MPSLGFPAARAPQELRRELGRAPSPQAPSDPLVPVAWPLSALALGVLCPRKTLRSRPARTAYQGLSWFENGRSRVLEDFSVRGE